MQIKCIHINNYNVINIIKYSCIDAISIFYNPGAISSSLSQIDKYYDGWVQFLSSLKTVTNNNDSNIPLMCYIHLIK